MAEAFIQTVKVDASNTFLREIINQLDNIGRKYYSGGASGYMAYGEPVHKKKQTGQVTLTQEELYEIRVSIGFHRDRDFDHDDLPSCMGHSGLLDLSQFPEKVIVIDPMTLPEVTKTSMKTIPGDISYSGVVHPIKDKSLRRFIPRTEAFKEHIELVREEFKKEYDSIYHRNITTKTGKCIGAYIYPARIERIPVYNQGGIEGALINKKGSKEIFETFGEKYAILDIAAGDHHRDLESIPAVYLKIRAHPLSDDEEDSDFEDEEE